MSDLKVRVIIDAVSKALGPIKHTQSAIKNLQSQSAKISSYSAARKATMQSSAALRQKITALNATKRALREADNPTDKLRHKVEQAGRATNAARRRLEQQRKTLSALKAELKSAGIATNKLSETQQRLDARVASANSRLHVKQSVTNGFKRLGRGVAKVGVAFGWIGLAVNGMRMVGGAIASVGRQFVGTAAMFEKFNVMLKGITGSSLGAKKAMAWINKFAMNTPMQLDDVTAAYIKMKNFGLDPTNGSLQSLVDMNSRMGGGQQQLQGMILALGQAWGKQKLQGDDILQLINAGVPVWDLLSKVTGKNVAQLHKMSESGQLGQAAIKGLIDAMGKLSKGASISQMKTWNGMVSNMGDQWTRFKELVMESGPFKLLKAHLGDLLGKINAMAANGKLKQWAETTGHVIVATFAVIKGTIKTTTVVLEALWVIADKLATPFKLIYKLGKAVGTLLNGLINKIDKIFHTGIGKLIGKSMAMLMAGLGSGEAQNALNNDAENQGRSQARQTLSQRAQSQQQTTAGKDGKNGQSNTHVKIDFDATGAPRMRVHHDGDATLETAVGRNLAGVM